MNDPYVTLGVPRTATSEEVKKAYRELESENEELRSRIAELEGKLGISAGSAVQTPQENTGNETPQDTGGDSGAVKKVGRQTDDALNVSPVHDGPADRRCRCGFFRKMCR